MVPAPITAMFKVFGIGRSSGSMGTGGCYRARAAGASSVSGSAPGRRVAQGLFYHTRPNPSPLPSGAPSAHAGDDSGPAEVRRRASAAPPPGPGSGGARSRSRGGLGARVSPLAAIPWTPTSDLPGGSRGQPLLLRRPRPRPAPGEAVLEPAVHRVGEHPPRGRIHHRLQPPSQYRQLHTAGRPAPSDPLRRQGHAVDAEGRWEEHTSELQSRGHLVCCLLLEKKK